jgi:dipeptidyl aminopeptidase/acylaminoacyl peptidase
MSATVAPHGSWSSPITAELVVAGAVSLGEVWVEGTVTWWSELRPQEGGRVQLVRLEDGGSPVDVLPEGYSARTRVHEYGGGAWWVRDGVVVFANWADQRLYRLEPGGRPLPLTPEPAEAHALRYADGRFTPDGAWIVCVREHHERGREARNEIVAVPARDAAAPGGDEHGGGVAVLAGGRDFVSSPRVSRDGRQLAWLTWDHPNMPWDGTELWIARLLERDGRLEADEAHRVAGGADESLVQPEWGRHGRLYVISDRNDWWNVHRVDDQDQLVAIAPVDADVGQPAWVFGQSRYGFTPDGTIVFTYSSKGAAQLAVASPGGEVRTLPLPFTSLSSLRVEAERVTAIAAASDHEPVVARVGIGHLRSPGGGAATGRDAGTGRDGGSVHGAGDAGDPVGEEIEILRPARDLGLDPGLISRARPMTFPTTGGATAHAYHYAPTNPAYQAPEGERPPLLVLSHGGPTAAATPAYSLGVQFWTSRGFAVVDVDYGGSTGYGRAYRRRLEGAWGIVDVDDCVAAAQALVAEGEADPDRLAIRGGSAGGFTTLAALTFRDVFRAGASHYGVADLAALARDTHKFESRYLDGLVGAWPADEAVYEERSPIRHTEQLSCPIILLQGLEDEIVPPAQAEMMVAALAEKGIPHAYLAFEGEQHGFRRAETIVAALNAELYFYSRVFGFELPDGGRPIEIAFAERLSVAG